jgi:hypothetical protein
VREYRPESRSQLNRLAELSNCLLDVILLKGGNAKLKMVERCFWDGLIRRLGLRRGR